MPRSVSTVRIDHAFAAARSFHDSPSQVSCPNSPGRGTTWNVHSSLPVRASKPRTSPNGPCGVPSAASAPPTRTLLLTSRGGVLPRSPPPHRSAPTPPQTTAPPPPHPAPPPP